MINRDLSDIHIHCLFMNYTDKLRGVIPHIKRRLKFLGQFFEMSIVAELQPAESVGK